MTVTTNRRWRIRPGSVTWRTVGTETVVLDLRSSTYLSLNGTASDLWALLAEDGATPSALAERICDEYPVDRDDALADVRTFLVDCSARGWID